MIDAVSYFVLISVTQVLMTVVYETEFIIVQYFQDIQAICDNPKTLASLKVSQVNEI